MKVVVVGGYGVFGSRVCRLLLHDQIDVVVAGRDFEKAAAFSKQYGGEPLHLDLDQDISPIGTARPDLVIDAAGPFQAYGSDPYRLARFCIRSGIHYADLSDDAAFTAGIAALDADAVAAGCFALSGVSSVPCISAAVASDFSTGLDAVILIETAIVPGNRAPRGRSVVASILRQAGAPLRLWRGGRWRDQRGWTEPRRIRFRSDGLTRWANLIGAPDLALFPNAFQADSVVFRAGLELGIMHWGLTFIADLRARGFLPPLIRFLGFTLWIAKHLERFGTDRGGMSVTVIGRRQGRAERRNWQMIAQEGHGPFIPAVPSLALARKLPTIRAGARPCIGDLALADIEQAMEHLSVDLSAAEQPACTLFEAALGEHWSSLPASIRRLHAVYDVESFSGFGQVIRGTGLIARLACWLFRLPPAGENIPLEITMRRVQDGEVWERDFGGQIFRSVVERSDRPHHVRERLGPLCCELALCAEGGGMSLPVRRGWLFGVPLPTGLLPVSKSSESAADGLVHFDVGLYAPLSGALIVRYHGHVRPHPREVRTQ